MGREKLNLEKTRAKKELQRHAWTDCSIITRCTVDGAKQPHGHSSHTKVSQNSSNEKMLLPQEALKL
jgi:hypothetical protein